jgi:hypothetical protein
MGFEVMGVLLQASWHNQVIMFSPSEFRARWVFDVMGVSLHAPWHNHVIMVSPSELRAGWV